MGKCRESSEIWNRLNNASGRLAALGTDDRKRGRIYEKPPNSMPEGDHQYFIDCRMSEPAFGNRVGGFQNESGNCAFVWPASACVDYFSLRLGKEHCPVGDRSCRIWFLSFLWLRNWRAAASAVCPFVIDELPAMWPQFCSKIDGTVTVN